MKNMMVDLLPKKKEIKKGAMGQQFKKGKKRT